MSYGPGGGVLSALLHVIGGVFSLVAGAIAFLLVLLLIALLVRFLWFGTRAAQVYLAKNGESARFVWPVTRVGEGPATAEPPAAAPSAAAPAAAAPPAAPAPSPSASPSAGHDDVTQTRPYETPDAPADAAAPKTPRKPMTPPSAS
ncbi:hypothetical protein NVV95_17535 [Herbiconiux sp. CPCC 205716]|uniref:Uncharacterized protein n=1 Tax=Herbiconiux gentiana TaxID=2970912 RepID=A0ABT2GJE9_9MICO|nr:hypothetical protein [Herbiconiux gentiana]MCS5716352.1 hypothetical protein [Herbiconiux gentiana]